MSLVYDDTSPPLKFPINVNQLNGTAGYLRHYSNYLYLSFIHKNGTTIEKLQAQKELAICERKLAFWERHPNFIRSEAEKGVAELKRQWNLPT